MHMHAGFRGHPRHLEPAAPHVTSGTALASFTIWLDYELRVWVQPRLPTKRPLQACNIRDRRPRVAQTIRRQRPRAGRTARWSYNAKRRCHIFCLSSPSSCSCSDVASRTSIEGATKIGRSVRASNTATGLRRIGSCALLAVHSLPFRTYAGLTLRVPSYACAATACVRRPLAPSNTAMTSRYRPDTRYHWSPSRNRLAFKSPLSASLCHATLPASRSNITTRNS